MAAARPTCPGSRRGCSRRMPRMRRARRRPISTTAASARKAADAALAVGPRGSAAVRATIDALRLAGDRDTARRDVAQDHRAGDAAGDCLRARGARSRRARTALDDADRPPSRSPRRGEGNAGRARAALVYALAQSGDVAGAKTELAKLDAMTRPYPLLPQPARLRRQDAGEGCGSTAASLQTSRSVAVSSLPSQQPSAGQAAPGRWRSRKHATSRPCPGESTSAMKAAQAAIRKGDWNRARTIYEALVARNPSDSEALVGARRRSARHG